MGPPRTEGWGGLSVQHAVTRSVRDSAAILDATHGIELGSRVSAPTPDGSFLDAVTKAPRPLRIALMLNAPAGTPVDAECIAAARATAKLCEDLGHLVEEAAPKLDYAAMGAASFAIIASSVAADVMDRAAVIGANIGPDLLEPITLAFVHYGKTVDAMSYVRANNVLQAGAIKMAEFMANYDMILSPTLATKPIELGRIHLSTQAQFQEWGAEMARYSPFTQLENLTGQPAMSVPMGWSADGLPIGVMFVGRYGDEAELFSMAGQLERAAPWFHRRAM
jgi:Asp-tRNA(Asn)/Glu-tRNA(Gln) amidotransferase A subunit family amidase